MNKNTDYQFVDTDTNALISELVSKYEELTGTSLLPASPEKLFIMWIASIIIHERLLNNYTGNQNLPSRADGANLDALGEFIYNLKRPEAQAAICTERFYISEIQRESILIPSGTRVTDKESNFIWETYNDAFVRIGDTYVDVPIRCQTVGTVGNGFEPGQITNIVDVFDYYLNCENITVSENGSDEATDEEYFELMRSSLDGYSCAGAREGYKYFAKKVSSEIADVVPNSPYPGWVDIYVLMNDGTLAGEEIKKAVYEACNADFVRPLTDLVTVKDAEVVECDLTFTYYIQSDTNKSAKDISDDVNSAVNEYILWQSQKFGRDINPDKLRALLSNVGIKRIDLVTPTFTVLNDGIDNRTPQVARIKNLYVTNGGYEDE